MCNDAISDGTKSLLRSSENTKGTAEAVPLKSVKLSRKALTTSRRVLLAWQRQGRELAWGPKQEAWPEQVRAVPWRPAWLRLERESLA